LFTFAASQKTIRILTRFRSNNMILTTKVQNLLLTAVVLCLFAAGAPTITAQTEDPALLSAKAKALFEAQKLTEALPLYEKLVQLTPNDPNVHWHLGFALLGQAANTTDPTTRKRLRIRARAAFVKANELGDNSQLVKGFIEGLPTDGGEAGFSDNAEANRLIQRGEAAFASGKMDEALTHYQNALKVDPRCYHAALFAGDVNMHGGNFPEAEKWYQKAISIDPYEETAYRYSATPLMKQEKYAEARDRYVEAYITSPYNRLAVSGMIQWGQITKTALSHPKVDVPEIKIGADGKANTTINLNPLVDDGSMAWTSYVATRESWRTEKFAKEFPKESSYRHTLKEEADALRSVVSVAKTLKPKKLNDQIATLAKLDQEGLLEAFILMAIPDPAIAQDHRAYLTANRDKLRRYVVTYVIGNK
jgi:tetratricopeptide (TPR) repeat protein